MSGTHPASTCWDAAKATYGRVAVYVRALAFWAAVVLPVVYLPPLLAGPGSTTEVSVLGALIGVHVAAIFLGHDYRGIAENADSRPG